MTCRALQPILVAALLLPLSAGADVLIGERLRGDDVRAGEDVPRRGATPDRVEERFGEPENRRDPVGDPPISRWDYPEFSVYFESDRVLHAVRRQ